MSAKLPRIVHVIAGAGPLLFLAIATVEGFVRSGYDPIAQPISALALGPRGWIQTANFGLLATALFATALVLRAATASIVAPAIFVLMAIGVTLAGIFPMDAPDAGQTLAGQAHMASGFLVFPFIPAVILVVARRFRRDPDWRSYYGRTLATGLFCLATIAFFLIFVGPPGAPRPFPGLVGLVQRLELLPFFVWSAVVVYRARERRLGIGAVAAAAALLLGCGSVEGSSVDARTPDPDSPAPLADVTTQLGPWQTPVPMTSVNTSYDDRTPWLSADGLTLYLSSNRPLGTGSYDIWRAKRSATTASFMTAENVTDINSAASEESPFVASSGSRIWFSRTVAGQGMEIFLASGSAGNWSAPAAIAEVSSAANDGTPMVSANGEAMYLFSRRSANGDADIYVSQWDTNGQAWQTPTTSGLEMVNTPALELNPHLSSDGLRLYFTSTRDGSYGVYSAARSTVDSAFSAPAAIAELNSVPTDGGIWISDDERYMILSRENDLFESRR